MAGPTESVGVMICILVISLHWYLTGKDLGKKMGWLQEFFAKRGSSGIAKTFEQLRVEAALQTVSEDNFVLAMSFLQHTSVPFICGFVLMGDASYLLFPLPLYCSYILIAKKYVEVTPRRMRLLTTVAYCELGMMAWIGWSEKSYSGTAMIHGLTVMGRAGMVIVYQNSKFHVMPQVCLTLLEVACFMLFQEASLGIVFLLEQLSVLFLVLSVAILLGFHLSGRLAAERKTTDAQQMLLGFRRILHGICDADVLLGSSLTILQHRGLEQFVSSREVAGKPFQEMLVKDAEELRRFTDFIATSTPTAADESDKIPFCLRVSLEDSSNSRVGVDIFHVALPNLYGSKETYHLLALRQDIEPLVVLQTQEMGGGMEDEMLDEIAPQPLPAFGLIGSTAALTRDNVLRRERRQHRPPASSAASVRSHASAASLQAGAFVLPTFPYIEEVKMVIDTNTPMHGLRQVHVKYSAPSPCAAGEDVKPDFDMPTLRKFVRPTDWTNIEEMVQTYAMTAARQPAAAARCFDEGFYMRRFDHANKYMLATHAELSPHPSSRHKLWFHLKDFVHFDRTAPACELVGVREQARSSTH
mmetsp:Transcript_7587/g.17437  ORF Transcript_7587/g.17437 Transcript_7587/m.17437 type:complete len:584 (-) Transcript_7587:41-1792(-)